MMFLTQFLGKMGFRDHVSACPYIPQPGSNRGYDPAVLLESFDFDSTVLTRYGMQEGAKRGYNSQKRNALSTPLIAFINDLRLVANLWLCSGDTVSFIFI